MRRSMNKAGMSHISCDRTAGLDNDANNKRIVKITNTAIARIETFISTFPIFIGKIIGG
jgi:hypothetical protein